MRVRRALVLPSPPKIQQWSPLPRPVLCSVTDKVLCSGASTFLQTASSCPREGEGCCNLAGVEGSKEKRTGGMEEGVWLRG